MPPRRGLVDNPTYFRHGGQLGVETKRGCPRRCVYCVDALAKGRSYRLRDPAHVADEVQSLLAQEIDVLHLCDAEFNLPPGHALAVCDELIRRGLGNRVRWYAYLSVLPFPDELAGRMRQAGCVGINFTSDSTNPAMLATYRQTHNRQDVAEAVRTCRRHGIRVMLDLLLGGPGETPETVAQTIADIKQIDPDCAGAALGLRVRNGCCYHGVSLNVDMDLSPFLAINPCGYAGMAVTQTRDHDIPLTPEQAGDALIAQLQRQLEKQP